MHADIHTINTILHRYGLPETVIQTESYIDQIENDWVKLIFAVTLLGGKKLVIKLLHEKGSPSADRNIVEQQSRFSEAMRTWGILTPKRYKTGVDYCSQLPFRGILCNVTVEDYCGQEVKYINSSLACEIGRLMARMHRLSLDSDLKIGCGTLFSAAYENDVDVYDRLCQLCATNGIDQETFAQIKHLREEKLTRIRSVWDKLPRCAVQGDISINNLVCDGDRLYVFDYNNAGDEVLVGDFVLEGLLTAFEMDLPEGMPESCREQIFTAFIQGYLSVRPLTPAEQAVVWDIYTLWHGLWFTRIVYHEHSLEAAIKRGDITAANACLAGMLKDMTQANDGRFLSQ